MNLQIAAVDICRGFPGAGNNPAFLVRSSLEHHWIYKRGTPGTAPADGSWSVNFFKFFWENIFILVENSISLRQPIK